MWRGPKPRGERAQGRAVGGGTAAARQPHRRRRRRAAPPTGAKTPRPLGGPGGGTIWPTAPEAVGRGENGPAEEEREASPRARRGERKRGVGGGESGRHQEDSRGWRGHRRPERWGGKRRTADGADAAGARARIGVGFATWAPSRTSLLLLALSPLLSTVTRARLPPVLSLLLSLPDFPTPSSWHGVSLSLTQPDRNPRRSRAPT